MKKYATPYLDENKKRIYAGDTLIIGENPEKHKIYEIYLDEKRNMFYASEIWKNGVKYSKPLDMVMKENDYIFKK